MGAQGDTQGRAEWHPGKQRRQQSQASHPITFPDPFQPSMPTSLVLRIMPPKQPGSQAVAEKYHTIILPHLIKACGVQAQHTFIKL